ncbi:MAG: hypothetical protein N2510_06370 [Ignavibacteria bacterium]|nr:hypothetical protein [Ignavibacteria bacterium]
MKIFSLIIAITFLISACKNDGFIEVPNNEPEPFITLLEPPDNSLSYSDTPVLKWKAFPSALSYRLQISFDANFSGIIVKDSVVTDTVYTLPPQSNFGYYYYWRVRANLPGNSVSAWSSIWRFRLILPPPEPPILIEPPNNATGQSFLPVFRWLNSPTAQSYRIQVSRNTLFSQIVLDSSGISSTHINCPELVLTTGAQYFWRVNASNSNGLSTSPWSVIFSFRTAEGLPPFTISGRVRFVDTNFSKSEYRLLLFNSWNKPGNKTAFRDTVIDPSNLINNELDYSFRGIPSGNYFIAVGIGKFLPNQNTILGIYGCDTVRAAYSNCPLNPPPASIINGNGLVNVNFLSWADTTKRIFP